MQLLVATVYAELSSQFPIAGERIGHSAGSILHSYVVDRLVRKGWKFDSVNFMAPAVRVDLFEETVIPAIKNGTVKRYNQFHLSDDIEQKDPTCKSILGYNRSLFYLVSQSLEHGRTTPILGMEKYFEGTIASKKSPHAHTWAAPGRDSKRTTHGGFDDDQVTMASVIALIKGNAPNPHYSERASTAMAGRLVR
jgi:hypothetical protein